MVIKKKVQGKSIFLNSNEKKNHGARKLTRAPRSLKKYINEKTTGKKMFKKMDLKISHGARKLTHIPYLKKTKEKSEKRKEKNKRKGPL